MSTKRPRLEVVSHPVNADFDRDSALLAALFAAQHQQITRLVLSRQSGVEVADLERSLRRLAALGYPIEFHPQGDVRLGEPGDLWSEEEVAGRSALGTESTDLRWTPRLLAETGSTNDVARDQGRQGAAAGLVVAAAQQTAGRGRRGRVWESPPGRGLYASFLLRSRLAAGEVSRLPIVASVAAVEAVEALTDFRPRIKWPNDLLLDGRKLGGLLVETEMSGGSLAFAVIGIGLNVRHTADDFSPAVRGLATSLLLATGQLYRRADLLVALMHALRRRLSLPFEDAREAWTASSLTLGQRVELVTTRGRCYGQAMGLDGTGALLLRTDSGAVETITAGDMMLPTAAGETARGERTRTP